MSFLNSISPEDLAVLATLVSIVLSENRSASENNVLGNLISTIGSSISTIASQQEYLESLQEKQKQIEVWINPK
jgi:hypothetical protein